jgi:cellulose synthase/poly-beta-1,6-N-acetylglucosamine synthase-like glycosyltransferase
MQIFDEGPRVCYNVAVISDVRPENSEARSSDAVAALPRISVVMPVFNGERYLRASLDALRKSDYPDFEIIVSDDRSSDRSAEVAAEFADRVVRSEVQGGSAEARNRGAAGATGEILCFVDQDVVIAPDTLRSVARYLAEHSDVAAVTGLLSKSHPNPDFFSQYKNLYMHYIMARLPERVTFLYGSLHAVRREAYTRHDATSFVDDTELGQRLTRAGKGVALIKQLEVVHLKRFSALQFLRNDFRIPFVWAETFLRYQGLKQMGKGGYAHARNDQILSLFLAASVTACAAAGPFVWKLLPVGAALLVVWMAITLKFILYLGRERGLMFALLSWIVTFVDHQVMLAGALSGLASAALGRKTNRLYRATEPAQLP